jgi:hypothetical protein
VQEANELLKSQHVKYLANQVRLDGSQGKTFQRKLNGQQFDAQPTARSPSDWGAKPADNEVIEPPRKTQRLEGAPTSPETATSLKIRIPALSQRLNYRRVTRGRPRKNRGLEPAASRESIATTSAQATCKSNSITSTDVPFTFPHSPLAFPPPTEGKLLPLTWIPQAALVIQLKHEDQEMVYYDPVPVAVQYSWPSQTGFPPVWSQVRCLRLFVCLVANRKAEPTRNVRDLALVPQLSRWSVSEERSGERIHAKRVWLRVS